MWRFTDDFQLVSGYPIPFSEIFPGIPSYVQKIDAAYERNTDGALILFNGITLISIIFPMGSSLHPIYEQNDFGKQIKRSGCSMDMVLLRTAHDQFLNMVLMKAWKKWMQQWYGVKMIVLIYSAERNSCGMMKSNIV